MSDNEAVASQTSSDQDGGAGRQRSTIAFPYTGLNEAVEVAKAIYDNVGSGECEDDQLAAWLKLSSKSSGYRVRLSASRLFGLIKTVSAGTHTLSDLGIEIVDPNRTKEARVRAFLNVPLFSVFFERWKGRQLPPTAALERELVSSGVAEKQKDRARQVLERSAQQAGFFEQGKDRLIRPGFAPSAAPLPNQKTDGDRGGDGDEPPLDPIIRGLIGRLPPPGSEWAEKERVLWLQILENSFRLVYRDSGEGASPDPSAGSSRETDYESDL